MEQAPSDKQFDITESHEITDTAGNTTDAAETLDKPEISRKRRILRKTGDVALTLVAATASTAATYGALKSGHLDSLPIVAHGDNFQQLQLSLAVGFPTGGFAYDQAKKLVRRKK